MNTVYFTILNNFRYTLKVYQFMTKGDISFLHLFYEGDWLIFIGLYRGKIQNFENYSKFFTV